MVLWIAIVIVAAATITVVLYPLLRRTGGGETPVTAEMAIYKDQLNELGADVERGVITRDEAEAARIEISRRLLDASDRAEPIEAGSEPIARSLVVALAIAAIAVPIAFYSSAGSPTLPSLPFAQREAPTQGDPALAKLIRQVEEQLEKRPNDARGWSVLAPAYMRLRRFHDAANAFKKAIELSPPNADLQTAYAEALTLSEAGVVGVDAHAGFQKALEIDPKNAKARFYMGVAKFQDGDKEDAVRRWKSLLAESPPNAPWRPTVQAYIARVAGTSPVPADETVARAPALDRETVQSAGEMSAEDRQQMIRGMVDRLASRLSEDGKDLNGWLRLIRARTVLGETDKAKQALADARGKFDGDENALVLLNDFAVKLGLETK